jgi:hypothetical protein
VAVEGRPKFAIEPNQAVVDLRQKHAKLGYDSLMSERNMSLTALNASCRLKAEKKNICTLFWCNFGGTNFQRSTAIQLADNVYTMQLNTLRPSFVQHR